MEGRNEVNGLADLRLLHNRPGKPIRSGLGFALVCPQYGAHSLTAQPVAAALISQEVAPAAGAALATGGINAPGHGTGSGNHRDPGGVTARSKDQAGIVHRGDAHLGGHPGHRADESLEPGGVGGGVHTTGTGDHGNGRPSPQFAEHIAQG